MPLVYYESLGPPFQCTVGVGHDFITRQEGEIREESGVDKWRKRKVFQERNGEMCQCVYWEVDAHWGGRERLFPIE